MGSIEEISVELELPQSQGRFPSIYERIVVNR